MPIMSCLFAEASSSMLLALLETPLLSERVHRFKKLQSYQLPSDGLAVVFLSGSVRLPWESSDTEDEPPERWPAAIIEKEKLQFVAEKEPWFFREAAPPSSLIERWKHIATTQQQPLAWWWWWERGDDLYADAAWLFYPNGTTTIATRTTPLTNGEEDDAWIHNITQQTRAPLTTAPLRLALQLLGASSELQYFAPTDSWSFPWEKYAVNLTPRVQ